MFKKEMENKIISVYSDIDNPDIFYAGKCIDYDDEYLLIHSLCPNGEDDGLLCIKKENIYRIDYNGKYENNLEKISRFFDYNLIIKDDIIIELLNFCKNESLLVEFSTYEENIDNTGYVKDFSDEYVTLEIIDENGEKDGETIVLIEGLNLIGCNSRNCRKIEKLRELKKIS